MISFKNHRRFILAFASVFLPTLGGIILFFASIWTTGRFETTDVSARSSLQNVEWVPLRSPEASEILREAADRYRISAKAKLGVRFSEVRCAETFRDGFARLDRLSDAETESGLAPNEIDLFPFLSLGESFDSTSPAPSEGMEAALSFLWELDGGEAIRAVDESEKNGSAKAEFFGADGFSLYLAVESNGRVANPFGAVDRFRPEEIRPILSPAGKIAVETLPRLFFLLGGFFLTLAALPTLSRGAASPFDDLGGAMAEFLANLTGPTRALIDFLGRLAAPFVSAAASLFPTFTGGPFRRSFFAADLPDGRLFSLNTVILRN